MFTQSSNPAFGEVTLEVVGGAPLTGYLIDGQGLSKLTKVDKDCRNFKFVKSSSFILTEQTIRLCAINNLLQPPGEPHFFGVFLKELAQKKEYLPI